MHLSVGPCRCNFAQKQPSSTLLINGWRHFRMRDYHRRMDTKLLELLVCPVTKGPLIFDREKQELISRSARLAYPLRDGIPILLEHEARTLTDEETIRPPAPAA